MKTLQFLKTRILFVFVLSASMLFVGCNGNDEPETIDDDTFYEQLGFAMLSCYTDIFNQNLAGRPSGVQNITANGPMGGSVVITGSTGVGSGSNITTADLLFSMTGVVYVSSSNGYTTDITLNGTTTETGSFSSTYASINYQSGSLHVKGNVESGTTSRSIDMTGAVSINRSTNSVTATIFGHTVAW